MAGFKTPVTDLNVSTGSTHHWEDFSTTVNFSSTSQDSIAPTGSAVPTEDAAAPKYHFVDVGAQGQFLFNPTQVDAAVGDIVVFRFLKLNHTVTQSSFDSPCGPIGGFDSGFRYYNPLNQTGVINHLLPFLVRDSEPTWFYCRQSVPRSHCSAGMVFGINTGDKMIAFMAKAMVTSFSARDTKTEVHGGQDGNTTRGSGLYSTGFGVSGPTAMIAPVPTIATASGGIGGGSAFSLVFMSAVLFLISLFIISTERILCCLLDHHCPETSAQSSTRRNQQRIAFHLYNVGRH